MLLCDRCFRAEDVVARPLKWDPARTERVCAPCRRDEVAHAAELRADVEAIESAWRLDIEHLDECGLCADRLARGGYTRTQVLKRCPALYAVMR